MLAPATQASQYWPASFLRGPVDIFLRFLFSTGERQLSGGIGTELRGTAGDDSTPVRQVAASIPSQLRAARVLLRETMARHRKMGRGRIFHRVVGFGLVLALGPQGWAQEVSPALLQAAEAAYEQQQQEEPQLLPAAKRDPKLPPANVDPRLVNKKVRVYWRDGRVSEGKLLDVGPAYIRLKAEQATEEISLTDIARVEKAGRSKAWLTVAIVGLAVGAVATGALIAAMQD